MSITPNGASPQPEVSSSLQPSVRIGVSLLAPGGVPVTTCGTQGVSLESKKTGNETTGSDVTSISDQLNIIKRF